MSLTVTDNSSLSQKGNGELIWSIQNAEAEKAYPVKIYWIWPELLESYLLKKESYTGTRPLLFPAEKMKVLPTAIWKLFHQSCLSKCAKYQLKTPTFQLIQIAIFAGKQKKHLQILLREEKLLT